MAVYGPLKKKRSRKFTQLVLMIFEQNGEGSRFVFLLLREHGMYSLEVKIVFSC